MLQHYLAHFDGQLKGERKTRLSREALDALIAYTYPGNVRELLNLCERLVVMGEGREITRADLPTSVLREVERSVPIDTGSFRPGRTLAEMMAAVERRILADAHREYGSQAKMAEVLGVNQSTIARKMKKYR